MVVGGAPTAANSDVELIDLSGQQRSCSKPANYPSSIDWGSVGVFFDGSPLVCGGNHDVDIYTNLCYSYNHEVDDSDLFTNFQLLMHYAH